MKTRQQRVYSYARFSSPAQSDGDSERRQSDAAKAFAKANGYMFDEGLRMTDRGLSGYHGTHRKKGALGAFLEKVNSGEVPSGSILVVENIDRLGREAVTEAIRTIVFGLLDLGITIETLFPRDTFTKENINNGGIWRLVAHIERANAESKRKSDLAHANWKQKRKMAREQAHVLTSRIPAWLQLTDAGNVEAIPEAAKTIREIFRLKLEGMGKRVIERKLNESAEWVPARNPKRKGSGWRASYIQKILSNRAVIGEFQPMRVQDGKRQPEGEPIADYFPAVVLAQTFNAVQRRKQANARIGGETGKATNVLKNLVRCGYCGGSMTYIDKGDWKYLMCDNARRGVRKSGQPICHINSQPYAEVELTVLDNCAKLKPELILPTSSEQTAEMKRLRTKIEGLAEECASLEKQSANFIDQIGRTANPKLRAVYEQRVEETQAKKTAAEAEQVEAERALHELERGAESFTQWQKDLVGLKTAIAKDPDTRIRLNAHLKEFIERIEIFSKGHEDSVEHVEAIISEYFPEVERAASFKSFRKYARQRLLSNEGRMFRVYYRTARTFTGVIGAADAGIQVAPASSLAQRTEVRGKDRRRKMPAWETLFKDFFDGRKQGFVPKAALLR